jgi:hypothetical protein
VAPRPVQIDSPPVYQTFQLEVGSADFLTRQSALSLAAARAVATLPTVSFAGLELFLINNTADEKNDGWLRLSGHKDQHAIIFFELVLTRVRRWFRKPTFRVALAAYLPPGSLNDVISLISDGSGQEEWEKQRDNREVAHVFAIELGQEAISHAPGTRMIIR